jgi:hypothetical protein
VFGDVKAQATILSKAISFMLAQDGAPAQLDLKFEHVSCAPRRGLAPHTREPMAVAHGPRTPPVSGATAARTAAARALAADDSYELDPMRRIPAAERARLERLATP